MNINHTSAAYDQPLLLHHILKKSLLRSAEQEIIYADHHKMTYRQLGKRVNQLGNMLKSIGIKAGDKVGVMDWDSHRYLECFFAVPMLGATLHTINVRLSIEQILYTINHAQDDIILVNKEFVPLLVQIKAKITTVKKFILLDDAPNEAVIDLDFVGEYEQLLTESSEIYNFPVFNENTRATLFYTTGTVGLPKGVYFSHRQLVLHTLTLRETLAQTGHVNFYQNDVYMPLTPMFHVHAWGIPYVATLLGVKQVYPGRYNPATILELITKENVTFSHCVPTIMQLILNHPQCKETDLSRWKVIIGGSALSQAQAKQALDYGIDIFAGYGLSETCPVLTITRLQDFMLDWPLEEQIKIRCKAGLPQFLVDIRIVDTNMQDLPKDGKSQGEIIVRAPWLTQGYLHDKENSELLWAGGWLHTGDIGTIDANGYLTITDRIKDVIKSGGEWISSLALENIISHHPKVQESAVIGIPDPKWGERPLALVVTNFGEDITDTELKDFIRTFVERGVISQFGIPDRIVFVDNLEKTSVGKLNKKCMKEKFEGAEYND